MNDDSKLGKTLLGVGGTLLGIILLILGVLSIGNESSMEELCKKQGHRLGRTGSFPPNLTCVDAQGNAKPAILN